MYEKKSTILFQGDSITDGGRSRDNDLNHVMGHGYAYLIAAKLGAKMPERELRFINRGCSGHQVSDLYARWQEDTINLAPDLISILIGINDIGAEVNRNAGIGPEKYERTYQLLLEDVLVALPQAQLVLCEPFILPVGDKLERWDEWKPKVDNLQKIVGRLAAKYGAVNVPFQEVLEDACSRAKAEYWLWDGIHPTPAGHELLAGAWLNAVNEKNSSR